jgi:hypothetical protein
MTYAFEREMGRVLPEDGQVTFDFRTLQPTKVTDEGTEIFTFRTREENLTYDVYVNERTVSVRQITRKTGVNKHSGATWVRWKKGLGFVLSLKKEKNNKPYLRIYKIAVMPGRRQIIFDASKYHDLELNWGTNSRAAIQQAAFQGFHSENTFVRFQPDVVAAAFAMWKIMQKYQDLNPDEDLSHVPDVSLLQYMAYPGFKFFPNAKMDSLKAALKWGTKPWLNEPENIQKFIRQTYGKEAVRKDMIKAVAGCTSVNAISICQQFSKLVPTDWLILLLKDPSKYLFTDQEMLERVRPEEMEQFHRLLKLMTPVQRKRFILMEKTASMRVNQQSLLMDENCIILKTIPDDILAEKFQHVDLHDLKTVHDSLAIISRDIRYRPVEIPQEGLTAELDEKTFTVDDITYVIRSPKINHELGEWGQEMGNCIGSYVSMVLDGHTHVFAVNQVDDGKMVANMEVDTFGGIRQLYGPYNRSMPTQMMEAATPLVRGAYDEIQERVRKARAEAIAKNYDGPPLQRIQMNRQ